MVSKLIKLINTLKYIQPKQALYFVLRRKFSAATVSYSGNPELRSVITIGEPVAANGLYQSDGSFVFLND